jgi:NCS2 family nucleobase:cation symporter-2/xanthine permease XanP
LASTPTNDHVRYEPDEKCTPLLSFVVAIQGVVLILPLVVSIVVINVLVSGQNEAYLTWSVFSALIIVAIITALHASRISRLGAGHLVVVGVTPTYIPLYALALNEGGSAMLASLMIVSALFFFAIATWLPQLRRVITPTVSGTVLMLIAVMVLPICLDRFREVPEGAPAFAGLCVAAVTLMVSTALILRAPPRWRPWSMLIGFVSGCMTAALLGAYDLERLYTAPWVGIPQVGFQGLDLTPAAGFWGLLPMFLIVTLVQAIKGIGDNVVIQRVSRRRPRTTDFRLLQGSLYANGVGILLSGLAGTPPASPYSSFTASVVNMTGVAARNVGYAIAVILLVLALIPKFTGALLTIPSPVMGAFLLAALGIFFVEGVQTITRDGLDAQKSLVVGVSFAIGAGLLQQNILEDVLGHPWGMLLGNGITVGAATAIALNVFLNVTSARPKRLETRLDFSNLPRIDAFMQEVAADMGWSEAAIQRLRSAGEETLSSLLQPDNKYSADSGTDKTPRLIIAARPAGGAVEMEFVSALEDEENLEDRLAYLNEEDESVDEREISFRLLRHYASSVRHQKYQGMDIVTVRVEA